VSLILSRKHVRGVGQHWAALILLRVVCPLNWLVFYVAFVNGHNYCQLLSNHLLTISVIELQARLLLDPLIGAYEQSLNIGHEATSALFDLVASVSSRMDRASVSLYHVKIFNLCLRGLDLRSNRPSSFASIGGVEKSVIGALSSLVLKLSENSFKPLFVSLLDWSQSSSLEDGGLSGTQLDRRISFFGLVNQLLEKLR